MGAAFANYFVPIQIGARDMAFPRLNALSYWLYLASGLLALSSYFATGGTADWGWTTYAPLNTVEFSPAVGGSMMGLALMLLMASSIVATVNFLVTIFRLRAPGMSLMRLPLFTWTWIFTSLLMLWAFPAFVSAISCCAAGTPPWRRIASTPVPASHFGLGQTLQSLPIENRYETII